MSAKMSLKARKELLAIIKTKYQESNWEEKTKILDAFVIATNCQRKHAIHLLNKTAINLQPGIISRSSQYDSSVREALIMIWHAANKICSKRLVPFLPEFINVLENHGHLSISTEVKKKLLSISSATVDRLLKLERKHKGKSISTTRGGALLKKQIIIRTFSDWNDIVPGFIEADLVAHCGGSVNGSFLNTLVLTDIVSGWTEFMPLLCRSEANVIAGLKIAREILPFTMLGLDTDNGCEFINYGLLEFCESEKITFTRSRAYRSNDQAHVEEKNGSIVRRLIGYDRYEGVAAWHKLTELYSVMRLYINFFQPSLKLCSKKRQGAKVIKKYDKAQTPYQRLINSSSLSEEKKLTLMEQYKVLDPIKLLKILQQKQEAFWKHAWTETKKIPTDIHNVSTAIIVDAPSEAIEILNSIDCFKKNINLISLEYYKNSRKPRKKLESRTWRTRMDPFEKVWHSLLIQLKLNPELTSKSLLEALIKDSPIEFNMNQLRTLQRRVSNLKKEQLQLDKEYQTKLMTTSEVGTHN